MFSTRTAPWMKLGELVDRPQTAAEAAKLGKMDFTVSLKPVFFQSNPDNPGFGVTEIPTQRAVVADDNGQFFGFVSGTRYHQLQYGEAFDFMDRINPHYIAAGLLRDRRQGFMVIDTGQTMEVLGGEDPHELYVVLRTSHDGTRAINISLMPLRGRCMNQLTLKSFDKNVQSSWSIKHLKSMRERLAEANDTLSKVSAYATRYTELVDQFANTVITQDQGRKILTKVIPAPTTKTDRAENEHTKKLDKIMSFWNDSPNVGFAGTGWGLINAVSELQDHHLSNGNGPEARFIGALQGKTHKLINDVAAYVLVA